MQGNRSPGGTFKENTDFLVKAIGFISFTFLFLNILLNVVNLNDFNEMSELLA